MFFKRKPPPPPPAIATTADGYVVRLNEIRLQVFSEDYFGMRLIDREAVAVRPLAPGLLQAIVQDVGNGAASRTVRWSAIRWAGKSDDELFELARLQGATTKEEVVETTLENTVQVFVSNGFYLSAKLLHTFAVQRPERGVLVAPLSWHHWCVHPVNARTVEPTLAMVKLVADHVASQMKVTDAERLRTDVYWLGPDGRTLEQIPVTVARDGTPTVPPSPVFDRVMAHARA